MAAEKLRKSFKTRERTWESDKEPAHVACMSHPTKRQNDWEIVGRSFFHIHPDEHKVLINSESQPTRTWGTQKGRNNFTHPIPKSFWVMNCVDMLHFWNWKHMPKGKSSEQPSWFGPLTSKMRLQKCWKDRWRVKGLALPMGLMKESLCQSVVINFGFNKASVHKLDPSEQNKLKLIADLVKLSDMFVELRGHSDNVGTDVTKATH